MKFFSQRLLQDLETTHTPLVVMYQAQAESAKVGFDFANLSLAFERLVEEVEELTDAIKDQESDQEIADEGLDIVFGLVNVLRHAGISEGEFGSWVKTVTPEPKPSLEHVQTGFKSVRVAIETRSNSEIISQSKTYFPIPLGFVDQYTNANQAIRANVTKYLKRCHYIETTLQDRNQTWSDITLDEIYQLWKEAKAYLKNQ